MTDIDVCIDQTSFCQTETANSTRRALRPCRPPAGRPANNAKSSPCFKPTQNLTSHYAATTAINHTGASDANDTGADVHVSPIAVNDATNSAPPSLSTAASDADAGTLSSLVTR